MTVYDDLALWALALLKDEEDVTNLVVAGAAGIVESGDLVAQVLQDAQLTRRETGVVDKVLAIVVVDTGESGEVGKTGKKAFCSVFVYDRGNGYSNIRATREAVIVALLNQAVSLVRGAYIVQTQCAARTGHRILEEFDLDCECVYFRGGLQHIEGDDIYS